MNKKRSETFDKVAQLYDKARPSYPSKLIEDVIELSALEHSAKILEIGTGTGKATIPFANKGYSIHCLEPGKNLAAVATENLRSYPKVTIENVKFEDWKLQAATFDLIISAQAIHWIPSEVAYPKVAKALKQTGNIAFFWNMSPNHEGEIFQQLDEVYKTYATWRLKPLEKQKRERENELLQSGYFKNLVVKQYPWSVKYSTQQYLDLLKTQSDYLILPQTNQKNLSHAIAEILNTHGGFITKPYVAALFLAQKHYIYKLNIVPRITC